MERPETDTGWVVLKYDWMRVALKVAKNPLRTDGYRSVVVDGDTKKLIYEPFMGRLEWCRFGLDIDFELEPGFKYYIVSGLYGDKLVCAFTDLGFIEVGGELRIMGGRLVLEVDRELDEILDLAIDYGGYGAYEDGIVEFTLDGIAFVGVYAMKSRLYFTGGPYDTVKPVVEVGGTGMFREAQEITPSNLRKMV